MFNLKGQMMAEYVIILFIVIAGLVAMQGVLKTGIMGNWFNSVRQLGEPYNPENTKGSIKTATTSNTTTYVNSIANKDSLYTLRMDLGEDMTAKTGTLTITAPGN